MGDCGGEDREGSAVTDVPSWDLRGYLREDKQVCTRLTEAHHYDDIHFHGHTGLDDLISFLYGSGIAPLIDSLPIERLRRPDIPPRFLHWCLFLMPFIEGMHFVTDIRDKLFKDLSVIQALGFNVQVVRRGFSRRNRTREEPCHIDTLYEELHRVKPMAWYWLFAEERNRLLTQGMMNGTEGTWALDATAIEVYGKYEGAGQRVMEEVVVKKNGRRRKRREKQKGYKIVHLQGTTRGREYVIAVRILPLNEHELTVAWGIIKEAWEVLRKTRTKLIALDRAFMDGTLLEKCAWKRIPVVVPLKENMDMLKDMRGLRRLGVGLRAVTPSGAELLGFTELRSLESCARPLNGILVLRPGHSKKRLLKAQRQRKSLPPRPPLPEGKEWGYVTTHALRTPEDVVFVYEGYRKHWTQENSGHHEWKCREAWGITRLHGRSFNAVCGSILSTLCAYNVFIAFRQKKGQEIQEKGLRRLRRHFDIGPLSGRDVLMVIYEGPRFGIVPFRQFVTMMGLPPVGKLEGKPIIHIGLYDDT